MCIITVAQPSDGRRLSPEDKVQQLPPSAQTGGVRGRLVGGAPTSQG